MYNSVFTPHARGMFPTQDTRGRIRHENNIKKGVINVRRNVGTIRKGNLQKSPN